jgi:hypothetical protein
MVETRLHALPIVKQDPGETFRNIIPDQSIPETRFGEKNHYEPF